MLASSNRTSMDSLELKRSSYMLMFASNSFMSPEMSCRHIYIYVDIYIYNKIYPNQNQNFTLSPSSVLLILVAFFFFNVVLCTHDIQWNFILVLAVLQNLEPIWAAASYFSWTIKLSYVSLNSIHWCTNPVFNYSHIRYYCHWVIPLSLTLNLPLSSVKFLLCL